MYRRTLLTGALSAAALPFLWPLRGMAQISGETVAGVVADDRDLDTLGALLIAADLVDTLQEPGPFTVFAPVNEAFDALGEATVTDLTAPENQERLRRLLMHHVVGDALAPDDLNAGTSFETLAGTQIEVTDEETLLIGGAEMIQPGMQVPNGFVHKIGKVLQPPEAA